MAMRKIIGQVNEYRESGYAAEGNPGEWIDKIMYIRAYTQKATSSYSEMFEKHGRCEMLH